MLLPSRKSESSFRTNTGSEKDFEMYLQEEQDADNDHSDKFLSIPFIDNDENDEESINRRSSASRLSRIVGIGVVLTVVAALAVALAYWIHEMDDHSDSDDNILTNACYEAPSCENVNIKQVYDPATGFTNNTGFNNPNINTNNCCNICPAGINSTVCFDTVSYESEVYRDLWGMETATKITKNCSEKTGKQDYDYVMLDQIYFPQFCNALKEGHDPTLSHLVGAQCTNTTKLLGPKLNIHGFWPNYYHGYPQCCDTNMTDPSDPTTFVSTLKPSEVEKWNIYPYLQKFWFDPTTSIVNAAGISCSTCYILNHEWQKHGSCFSPEQQEFYFASGMEVHLALSNITKTVMEMNGSIALTANITSLYNHTVNVICDKQSNLPSTVALPPSVEASEVGMFMEIQSCWDVVMLTYTAEEILSLTYPENKKPVVSIFYDKKSGQVHSNNIHDLWTMIGSERALSNDGLSGDKYGKFDFVDVADYYGINCSPADDKGQFTKPCPTYAYLGGYPED